MVVGEKILATNLGFSSHFAHGDSRTWNSWSFLGRSATGAFPWSDSLNNFLGECDVYILYIYTLYIYYIYILYIHYIYTLYIYTIYILYIYCIYTYYIYYIYTLYIYYIYTIYIYYIYILYIYTLYIYTYYIYTIKTIYIHYIYIHYIYTIYIYTIYSIYFGISMIWLNTADVSSNAGWISWLHFWFWREWISLYFVGGYDQKPTFFSSNHILFKLGHLFIG